MAYEINIYTTCRLNALIQCTMKCNYINVLAVFSKSTNDKKLTNNGYKINFKEVGIYLEQQSVQKTLP